MYPNGNEATLIGKVSFRKCNPRQHLASCIICVSHTPAHNMRRRETDRVQGEGHLRLQLSTPDHVQLRIRVTILRIIGFDFFLISNHAFDFSFVARNLSKGPII